MIKKFFAILSLSLLLTAGSTGPTVSAWDPFGQVNCTAGSGSAVCTDKTTSTANPVTGIILKVVNIVAVIAGVAAVITIIIAGIRYIISGGDPSKVNTAKNAIIYAVIGLVVIILSRSIIAFVINRV